MNKKELIKIIELVVRKEVKKQMTEIFINDEKEISISETISKPKVEKKKSKKQYTKKYYHTVCFSLVQKINVNIKKNTQYTSHIVKKTPRTRWTQ